MEIYYSFSKTEFNVYFKLPFGGKRTFGNSGSPPFLVRREGYVLYGQGIEGRGPGVIVSPHHHPQRSAVVPGLSPHRKLPSWRPPWTPALFQLLPWSAWGQMAMGSWEAPHMILDLSSHFYLGI